MPWADKQTKAGLYNKPFILYSVYYRETDYTQKRSTRTAAMNSNSDCSSDYDDSLIQVIFVAEVMTFAEVIHVDRLWVWTVSR